MKRKYPLFVLLLVIILGAAWQYYRLPRVINRVRSSVVYVKVQGEYGQRWTGSGVVLDNGLVLTARHVIADANMVSVTFDDGSKVKSSEFFVSKDIDNADLGLIIIDGVDDHAHLPFGSGTDIGDRVFIIGSPFGDKNSAAVGIFSAYDRIIQSERLHQLDINGAPGNSGCPVFNRFGNVIGILVRGNPYGMVYIVPLEICKATVGVYENVKKAQATN
jgi:serine protease Do